VSAEVHATVREAKCFVLASRFTGHACVTELERALGKLTAFDIPELVAHSDFRDALDDYGISLTEPLALRRGGRGAGGCSRSLFPGEPAPPHRDLAASE